MLSKRIVLSWIFASLTMFGISYSWHGIFLNDLSNLDYPQGIFLFSASIVYLVIGFVLVKIFSSSFPVKHIRNFFARGLLCGAALGLFLYMLALVLGVTFTKHVTLASILVDVPWQMFEQAIGGVVIGTIYSLIFEPMPFRPGDERI
jgi:hypothetical protein